MTTSVQQQDTIAASRHAVARASILNWTTTYERDPKILAAHAFRAATLTALVLKGYNETVAPDGAVDPGGHEYELTCEAADLSALLSFVLARELGALDAERAGA